MANPHLDSFSGDEDLPGGGKGLKSKKNAKSKMGLKGTDLEKDFPVEAKSPKRHWKGKITHANAAKTEATAMVECDQVLVPPMPRETETVTVTVTNLTGGASNAVVQQVETEPVP